MLGSSFGHLYKESKMVTNEGMNRLQADAILAEMERRNIPIPPYTRRGTMVLRCMDRIFKANPVSPACGEEIVSSALPVNVVGVMNTILTPTVT